MNSFLFSGFLGADFASALADLGGKSIVLSMVALLALRCMRRWSAAARHFLLLMSVAALAVLPLLTMALPRLDVLPDYLRFVAGPGTNMKAPAQPVEPSNRGDRGAATDAAAESELVAASDRSLAVTTATAEQKPGDAAVGTRNGARSHWSWMPLAWAVGFCCIVLRVLGGLAGLARLERSAQVEESGPLFAALHRLVREAGSSRRIQLLVTERRAMPMTWGHLRPKILLPAEAWEWPEHRLNVVLRHELAHIQRRDFSTTLIGRLVCAVYWFNPMVWLVAREMRAEQEQACDDRVLSAGEPATGYAEDVLRIAAARNVGGLETAGALTMARTSGLEARLQAILDGSRSRSQLPRLTAFATVGAMGIVIVPLAMLQAAQSSPSSSPAGSPGITAVSSVTPMATLSAPTTKKTATVPGLIGWWRAEGDATDSIGKHDGLIPYGMQYIDGAPGGRAFDFRRRTYAISDQLRRVSVRDSEEFQLSETFTVEARIQIRQFGGIICIRGDDRPGYDTWQLDVITPGKISFNFDDAENNSEDIRAAIQTDAWYHVVATFDRGTMKLYLNGSLAAQSITQLRPNPLLDPARGAWLGIGNTGGDFLNIPFDGLIDEVKIYSRSLSESEVAEAAR